MPMTGCFPQPVATATPCTHAGAGPCRRCAIQCDRRPAVPRAGAVRTRGRARAQDVAVPDVHRAAGTGAAVLPRTRRTIRHVLGSRYIFPAATSIHMRFCTLHLITHAHSALRVLSSSFTQCRDPDQGSAILILLLAPGVAHAAYTCWHICMACCNGRTDPSCGVVDVAARHSDQAASYVSGCRDGYLQAYACACPRSASGACMHMYAGNFNLTALGMLCHDTFGVKPDPDYGPVQYGSRRGFSSASNIVFSNGEYDPWRSGVRDHIHKACCSIRLFSAICCT